MTEYYPPVFGYKPSFDSKKGDNNKMEVHYTRQMETPGGRGGRGGRRGQGAAAPPPQNKMMKRTVEVQICKTTNVDKTLHMVYKFKRERLILEMPWSEVRYNFTNCLGKIPQLRLEKVCEEYLQENGV